MVIAGPVTRRIVVGGGFTTYLDRSFGVVIHDTINLRVCSSRSPTKSTSDGAISDLRIAVAARLHSRLALGSVLHRLTGSTRVVAKRTFRRHHQLPHVLPRATRWPMEDWAVSASLLFDVTSDVRLAGWFRADSKLRADVGGHRVAENDLPLMYGAGVQWRAGAQATVAGERDVAQLGAVQSIANAHDTFKLVVRRGNRIARIAFRLGLRGGQLPFRGRENADRGRILRGARPAVLRRPRPPRSRTRAAAAQRLGTHRARLDVFCWG